jgi:hypothetical protein
MIAMKSIDVNLSIELVDDLVMANVLFTNNNSEDKIYLDPITICADDVFRNNIFSITDENGIHVLYSGIMGKRMILPEDFIELEPGENIQTKITINKGYNLVKGHKYSIRFCANNPSYLGKQKLIDLFSNKVEITY